MKRQTSLARQAIAGSDMQREASRFPGSERLYREVASRVGDSPAVLFTVEEPPSRRARRENQVVVGLYAGARRESLVAIVDREKQALVDLQPVQVQFQLSDEERQQAEQIAAKDERVRKLLNGRAMNPLTRLYFPQQARVDTRHAIVFLRPSPSQRWYAIVDLSSAIMLDVISRQQLAGR